MSDFLLIVLCIFLFISYSDCKKESGMKCNFFVQDLFVPVENNKKG